MPNVQNIFKLINHLKKVNKRNFDMADWLKRQNEDEDYNKLDSWREMPASEIVALMETGENKCNTVGCIAGHAALLSRVERQGKVDDLDDCYDIEQEATEWLDLNYNQVEQLFRPVSYGAQIGWGSRPIRRATLPKAIAVLENLAKTTLEGKPKVDWRTPIRP